MPHMQPRRTTAVGEQPLDIIVKFARHYTHGPSNEYDHLFYFSTLRVKCESLLMFGGYVYKQNNGFVWYLGNRKNLIALYKLLESREDLSDDMKSFLARMRLKGTE
jgi:hypothetical protein